MQSESFYTLVNGVIYKNNSIECKAITDNVACVSNCIDGLYYYITINGTMCSSYYDSTVMIGHLKELPLRVDNVGLLMAVYKDKLIFYNGEMIFTIDVLDAPFLDVVYANECQVLYHENNCIVAYKYSTQTTTIISAIHAYIEDGYLYTTDYVNGKFVLSIRIIEGSNINLLKTIEFHGKMQEVLGHRYFVIDGELYIVTTNGIKLLSNTGEYITIGRRLYVRKNGKLYTHIRTSDIHYLEENEYILINVKDDIVE